MEIVLLRCPRCRGQLRREVPPEQEFISVYCLCKSAGDVRAAHDLIRMLRVSLEELVPVG